MQTGRGGMGTHKHGISGHSGKSPAFRHWLKREAERDERRKRASIKAPATSVHEAVEKAERK